VNPQDPPQPVAVIGAGLDLGAGRRGVDMGPSAIRYAGLDDRVAELGRGVEDRGDVVTAVAEATSVVDERMRYLPQIKATCERIADGPMSTPRRPAPRSSPAPITATGCDGS